MESSDRSIQAKAFDETKAGVKGLVARGITEIPTMFHAPPAVLKSLKQVAAPSSQQLTIPTLDLKGGSMDLMTRRSVVEKIGDAAERWGFFQVVNHGISVEVMERMKEGIRRFHEQDPEVKKQFYSRDHSRDVLYYSNVDLHAAKAASWRGTLACYTSPDPPKLHDLPAVCG